MISGKQISVKKGYVRTEMIQSLYSASSALRAYSAAQNVTAHNIANVNTPAFRSSFSAFSEIANQGGVRVSPVRTDESTGYLISTGNPLDLSIKGSGYFRVTDAQGNEALTRRGDFSLDAEGSLVDRSGNILAANAAADGGRLEIDKDGNIYSDGAFRGRIEVVDSGGNEMPEGTFEIETGTLEASNVDIAKEIIDSMVYLNSYKANIVTTQTADTMLGTIIDMTA
jgi:flagellar hook protein FlgE